MDTKKMRHQRGRVRPTARPAEVAAHPEDRWSWRQEVVVQGTRAHVICAHCRRTKPCPTEEYLHGQSGHDLAFCCDPFGCYVFENARYAREHEVV